MREHYIYVYAHVLGMCSSSVSMKRTRSGAPSFSASAAFRGANGSAAPWPALLCAHTFTTVNKYQPIDQALPHFYHCCSWRC